MVILFNVSVDDKQKFYCTLRLENSLLFNSHICLIGCSKDSRFVAGFVNPQNNRASAELNSPFDGFSPVISRKQYISVVRTEIIPAFYYQIIHKLFDFRDFVGEFASFTYAKCLVMRLYATGR